MAWGDIAVNFCGNSVLVSEFSTFVVAASEASDVDGASAVDAPLTEVRVWYHGHAQNILKRRRIKKKSISLFLITY